jgi:hypothetical protein
MADSRESAIPANRDKRTALQAFSEADLPCEAYFLSSAGQFVTNCSGT